VGIVATVRSGREGQQALRVGVCDTAWPKSTGSRRCELCNEHGGFPIQQFRKFGR
jgi:hypothetical protein